MKIRLRVSTGEEWPGGSGVDQMTFLSGPNSVGSPIDAETPVPLGPRNCSQSSAAVLESDDEKMAAATSNILNFDIENPIRPKLAVNLHRLNGMRWILVDERRKRKAQCFGSIQQFESRLGGRSV